MHILRILKPVSSKHSVSNDIFTGKQMFPEYRVHIHTLWNWIPLLWSAAMYDHLCKVHKTMHSIWFQCCAINHLIYFAPTFFKQMIWPNILPMLKTWRFLRFSNHIYLVQENLRCLCLTRWLANQGWLRWGLGHPKCATNIIESCSTLISWSMRSMWSETHNVHFKYT